ncbi:hypothetical protein V8C86DRAFT_3139957 [Haematococcus lacustris]
MWAAALEEVERGHYPGVTVKFIPGRSPELFMFDATGRQVEQLFVEHLTFDELGALMLAKGFARVAAAALTQRPPAHPLPINSHGHSTLGGHRHHAAKARLATDGSAINFVRTPLPILPIGKSGLKVQQPPPAQSVVAVAAVEAVEANPGAAQAAGVGANSMATSSHTGQAARAVRSLPEQDSEVDV